MAFLHDFKDAKMHDSVQLLRIMFDQMATKFYKAVVLDGSDLLNHHKTILSATSVSELDVNRMSVTLRGAKRSFQGVEDNMIGLQYEVHYLIESVRKRIRALQEQINDNEIRRRQLEQQIQRMKQEMSENEERSAEYDRLSEDMTYAARRMDKEAEEAAAWGAVQIFGAVGSLAIGYATGGLAYAVLPAGVFGLFGVSNTNEANEYSSKAERYRSDARRYERGARELRINIRQTDNTIEHLKSDTEHINSLLNQFEESLAKINELSESLYKSVGATDDVIATLQNMEVAIKNAELDTESLQQRFKQLPNVFKKAESILIMSKSAWGTIKEVLKIHYKLLT